VVNVLNLAYNIDNVRRKNDGQGGALIEIPEIPNISPKNSDYIQRS
jgi:hypothetical protein